MPTFEMATEVACTPDELFAYHARPGALTRLTPPFERVRVVDEVKELEDGAVARLEIGMGPVWTPWVAAHERVFPGRGFVDVMREGPFRSWRHEHVFEPLKAHGEERAVLVDRITFEPPGGGLGASMILDKLARVFTWRHATTRLDVDLFRALPSRPLVVGITGASGLIGTEVSGLLRMAGHTVRRFTRGTATGTTIHWDPATGHLGEGADDLDAVIHLAGEPIAENRLDEQQRRLVRESRVDATERLVRTLASLPRPPHAFLSASAVGVYGDRGDEVLDDDAPPGTGFLADLCCDWEAATRGAEAGGMRAVSLRLGLVLSPQGGSLERMLLPFRAGLGARLGDGRQWMPVVAIDDVGAMFYRALVDERAHGAFNAVGPEPLQNHRFTHLLGAVLGRPAPFFVPRFAAKMLFGGALVDEALLASQRAVPARLFHWGHVFRHPSAEDALRHVLGRPSPQPSSGASDRDDRETRTPSSARSPRAPSAREGASAERARRSRIRTILDG